MYYVRQQKILKECDKCGYKCDKKITFNKHKNIKHTKVASINNDNKAVTSKDTFYWDQCIFSCMSESALKKPISQTHESWTYRQSDECDLNCLNDKWTWSSIEAHKKSTAHCWETDETVCDECISC